MKSYVIVKSTRARLRAAAGSGSSRHYQGRGGKKAWKTQNIPPRGVEPRISRSVVGRLIHWAMEAIRTEHRGKAATVKQHSGESPLFSREAGFRAGLAAPTPSRPAECAESSERAGGAARQRVERRPPPRKVALPLKMTPSSVAAASSASLRVIVRPAARAASSSAPPLDSPARQPALRSRKDLRARAPRPDPRAHWRRPDLATNLPNSWRNTAPNSPAVFNGSDPVRES